MIRPILTEIGIFLVPFAVYAAILIATRGGVFSRTSWPIKIVGRLAIGSFVLVVISLVLLAHFSGSAPDSTYVPAHMEGGKLVPGETK